jgi:ATP-binding cassette, subfamily C (CFTR/MRP), member 1
MINLLSINAQTLSDLPHVLNMAWSCFFNILIAVVLLWRQLGFAALVGCTTMVLFLPINSYLMGQSKKIQIKHQKKQDTRLKMINEILNGIKVIKFYAWEMPFESGVEKTRQNELQSLKAISILNAISNFSWTIAPFLVSSVSFGIFILSDDRNVLTPTIAFVSLSLFNLLKHPLTMLPLTVSNLVQAYVSLGRISEFLLEEEISTKMISHTNIEGYPISIVNANLGWNPNEPQQITLRNINLKIKEKSLVALIGRVGSGKSSLLSGILGEMYLFNGTINIPASYSTAYSAQQAWIQNGTIKETILFGNTFNEQFYKQVVYSCGLERDLEEMINGDDTEIGENGINLSGGQKQRLGLARAVYMNADIYFLDDPLSAVDAIVGKHIFDNVIGPNGILKNKTRLFTTNALNFLNQCDEIVTMEGGFLVQTDPVDDLKDDIKVINELNDQNNFKKEEEEEGEEVIQIKTKPFAKSKPLNKEESKKFIEKETVVRGEIKSSIIFNYFKALNYYLTATFFSSFVLSTILLIGSNFWLSNWSNNATINDSLRQKLYYFGVYVSTGFFSCFFILFAEILYSFMYTTAAKHIHRSMLLSILKSNIQFFETTPVGRILNRFGKDINILESKIPESFKQTVRCSFSVLSVIIVLLITSPWLIVVLIPIYIIFYYIRTFYSNYSRQIKRLEAVSRSPIYSHFGETLTGVGSIRAFKVQERFMLKMQELIDDNLVYFFADMYANRWLSLRLELCGTLIMIFATLFALFSRNTVSAGTAGLAISYSMNITQVLIWLVRSYSDFDSYMSSLERIEEFTNNVAQESAWQIENSIKLKGWPSRGAITFDNFSIKYRDDLDSWALANLTFQIKGEEKIGIVGRTGAGKSSITLSLFRIIETNSQGRILIDGININDIGLHNLRQSLTIIPQDPVIFCGTLRFNIDPFDVLTDDELWDALEKTHLSEFVASLDKKLMFECSEGGSNLSVGQRQLICLTRALLKKSKIVILDEATATVDHTTDELIQKTIKLYFSHCTILTIAHRLNTIMDSSR